MPAVGTAASTAELPVDPAQRRLIALAMMFAGTMQGMDTFASAVALPHIRGVMSAAIDEASWILTAYLVASAIFTPLFAWLSRRFGHRRLILIVITGFIGATLLVSQANTIGELVVYRFLQGLVAAGLNPLSQQIIMATYPRDQLGSAFAWLTTGRMSGVMVGPVIGGILTEYVSWRWVYLSNLPIAVLGLFLVWRFVPESERRSPPRFDFFGFVALSVAIGAMQLFLDRGERHGWFEATEIVVWAISGLVALYLFLVHVLTTRDSYVDLRIFANRDYCIGVFFVFLLSFMIFGYAGLIPPILQDHMGYPVSTAGLLMVPRGLGTMIASMISGALLARIEARPVVVIGILCMAISTWMMSQFTREVDPVTISLIVGLQGMGFGFLSVASMTIAFQTLSPYLRPDGTSIMSLSRRLGASVGVSVLTGQLIRSTQESRNVLIEHISDYSERLRHVPLPEQWDMETLSGIARLHGEIDQQAEFMAYLKDFQLMTVLILMLLPLVLLIRRRPRSDEPAKRRLD